MKRIQFCQQSIKLLGFITVALFVFSLFSCSTEKVKDVENPTNPSAPSEVSEDVLKKVAAATQVAGKFFHESNSISELEKHLDEIRKTEGVVDVWTDDQTMYVKYEGWGIMPYYYPPIFDNDGMNSTRSMDNEVIYDFDIDKMQWYSTRAEGNIDNAKTHYRLNDSETHSVVIYDAYCNDNRNASVYANAQQKIIEQFEKMKYKVDLINSQEKYKSFFHETMYDYDIVFINTHGHYCEYEDDITHNIIPTHWLMSGLKYKEGDRIDGFWGFTEKEISQAKEEGQGISIPFTKVGCIKEVINDSVQESYYWLVSEDGLAAIQGNFKKQSIVFCSACASLKGPHQSFNDNMGKVFCDKGAVCYLGYDEITRVGLSNNCAFHFFEGLLDGLSIQSSYNKLDPLFLHDTEYFYLEVEPGKGNYIKGSDGEYYPETSNIANYILITTNARLHIVTKGNNEENKHVCITHPKTDTYEEKGNNVTLMGSIKIADPNNDHEYGFALHTTGSNTVSPIKPGLKYGKNKDNFKYNKEDHILSFWCTVNKDQFKDVDKFCAFLCDSDRYCLGDLKDLSVENVEGRFCPDENHPHAIDLGLPSGNKWSCCDLGAKAPLVFAAPERYPWGYITPINNEYNEYTDYIYSGAYFWDNKIGGYTCDSGWTYLGDDISGTEYDAVFMNNKWGKGWVLPNYNDFKELLYNCTIDKIDNDIFTLPVYRITGPNGNYIEKNPFFYIYWSSTLATTEHYVYYYDYMTAYNFNVADWYNNSYNSVFIEERLSYIIGRGIRNFATCIWPVYK